MSTPAGFSIVGAGDDPSGFDTRVMYEVEASGATLNPTIGGTPSQPLSAMAAFLPAQPPTVTAVTPNIGLTAGGTAASITGTQFLAGASVNFGASAATSVVVSSTSAITCVSPAHAAGSVDVTVATSGGTSATSSADIFTYIAPTAVSASVGSLSSLAGSVTAASIFAVSASVGSLSSLAGSVTVASVSVVNAGQASVSAIAYAPTWVIPIYAQPMVANAFTTAFGPTNFAGVGTAAASAFALSPTNFVRAQGASVTATAYAPTWSVAGIAGVASVVATAYSLATGSVGVSPTPITAGATAQAYRAGLPPFSQIPITFLEVAFNNNIFDPLSSMVWTNITQYMNKDATIVYGREHNLDGTSAATLEVTLNDRDGRFTPYNISSPYYGNGRTTGLIPSKPVRMFAQNAGVNYPVFYGYVDSWTPSVLDPTNQDAVLHATDLLGVLGKTYLANTTIYPNLVGTSNPIAEFRLGDFTSSYNGTTTQALADYTSLGGTGSIVVPNLPAASVAALQTPFYLGGQTGQFLYDINTQIALGNSSTAQNAITQNQQNIQNAEQSLTSDEAQLVTDQAQLAADQATLANDIATAENITGGGISDASAAYSAVGNMYLACTAAATGLVGLATSTYNQAVSDGHTNTINSAAFTLGIANGALSVALSSDGSAANIIGAFSALQSQQSAAAANNAVNVVNTALANVNNAVTWIGNTLNCFQATEAQANTDADTNTANSAAFAEPYAQAAQTDAQNALDALYTVQSDAQNAQNAWNTVVGDQSQITQDNTYITKDEALIAADQASITAGSVAAQTTVAYTSAYVIANPGSSSIYGGVGWFTTLSLPVPTYLNQVIATISQPTGGTATTVQVNTNGYVTLNYGGTVEVTSASVINAAGNPTSIVNDGNVHMIAWTLSAAHTMSLYLDGILQGSFTNSGLYPGIQASPHPKIAIGGSPLLSGTLQGDFIGTVQDFVFFSTPPTAAAIAALYVLGSKFQHIHTTTDRTNDALLIGLGQTAYNNIPNDVMGNSLCFPEVNQTIQTTALSYIGQVAETENGFFFQNPNATITQLPINWVQTNPSSEISQGLFADNTSTVFHYGVENFQFPLDNEDLYSSIQIMQSTGTTSITDTGTPTQLNNLGQFIEVTNNTSASTFGPNTLQQSGILLENQSDMYFLANLLLARYAFPIPRVQSIQLSSANANNLPQMLGRQLWDKVTVQRQGPGETSFSQECVVEQITHKIDVTVPVWTTTFALSPFELIYINNGYGSVAGVAAAALGATVTTH
jgi:hypothetical protein